MWKKFRTEHKSRFPPLPMANILSRKQTVWISTISNDRRIAFLEKGAHTVPAWPQANQDPPCYFVHLYSSDVAATSER